MTPPERPSRPPPEPSKSRTQLRDEAEARLAGMLQVDVDVDPIAIRRLVHELTVHQIELEMQNEELRRTQAAMETARVRYFDLYDQAPIAYLTINSGSNIIECNQRASALLGFQAGRLTGRRLHDLIVAHQVPLYVDRLDRLLAAGEEQTIELEMRRADRSSFWAQLTIDQAHAEPDVSAMARVTITDITARKRMEDDAARLAAIVASSDQAIISETLQGEVTSWNAGAERLFGYLASEAIGASMTVLVPPKRLSEREATVGARKGETSSRETGRRRKDGTLVPVFEAVAPILDEYGRISGVSYIARDISDQVEIRARESRLVEDLRQREQALRESDRRKDDFIATLAHELRNPLAPIRNAVTVLRHASGLDPQSAWCRDVIDRQVGHMATLLDDLLDVSRITRNVITLRRDRLELAAVISEAIETTRPLIEARGHELVVDLPATPIEVEGDLTRLMQIFGNLLNNAAKYTDPNGHIEIRATIIGDEVEVVVSDSGIGIDRPQLPRIFEFFSQIDSAIDRFSGRARHRLALVKALVEKHGGSITASSGGLGKGSQFTTRLPLAKSLQPDQARNRGSGRVRVPEAGDPGTTRLRVLVVDDNADAADSLALLLRVHGFDTQTANDGEAALELARQHHPDAVLLDVGMPRLDGYEVGRRLRAQPWGKKLLLIACTGWGQPEDHRHSADAGFDHHLVKPIDPGTLLALLDHSPPVTKPDAIHS